MEDQKKKKRNTLITRRKMKVDDVPTDPHQNLPHEVIVDNILTRLPVKNLAKECALVCMLWYKSITHPHFTSLYTLLQSYFRNNGYPNVLIFDILNTPVNLEYLRHCTLRLDMDNADDINDVLFYSFRKLTDFSIGKQELVGHCNGLQCLRSCCVRGQCYFHITNPSCRPKDLIAAMYPVPSKSFVFCCGFGFDSLSSEYKIVLIYSNTSPLSAVTDLHDIFKCMVFTLGSKSWRESSTPNTLPVITISTGEEKKKRVIMSRMSFSRSAIHVGGALYWRVLTRDYRFGGRIGDEEDQEIEMLLCFDIHREQLQLISLPIECELRIKMGTTTMTTEQEQQLIDHCLLEFQGSLCIARLHTSEQKQRNNNCCNCTVHLYILKDRLKSAWSTESLYVCRDTSMIQDMSNLPPCIIEKATSATTMTTTTTTAITISAGAATTTSTTTTSTTTHAHQPITWILCVSDRVILYWFDDVCVQFYDLRRKHLKMANYKPADPTKEGELFFDREVRRQLCPFFVDDTDTANKLIYCRRDHIDYKLNIYVENFLPLKTFIPKGCTISRDFEKWFSEDMDIEDGLGYVYTNGRNRTPKYHCFCKRSSKEGSR